MKLMLFTLLFFLNPRIYSQESILTSPNGKIEVKVGMTNDLEMSLSLNGNIVVDKISPYLHLEKNLMPGKKLHLREETAHEENEIITAIVPTKSSLIKDNFRQMVFHFEEEYDFIIRVYDNGMAYRFVTHYPEQKIKVMDEGLDIDLPDDIICYFPEEESLISHFENYYEVKLLSEIKEGLLGSIPMLLSSEDGSSVVITESDVYDYPNLFLVKKGESSFKSKFPKVVIKTQELQEGQDRLEAIEDEASYIAETKGERTFPWRVFMISENDKEIISNNLVYQLASPQKIKDVSWIKPGKVAWDWWNANNIYGVDFESGLNTETYKYYIDFASMYGLEYIILDEGWSKSTLNVMEPNDDINIQELVAYANQKNVGIILWSLWRPLDEHMDKLLALYNEWGIKGVKVDFIQRADQYVVNFYERLAKKAAEHHLLIDYHGGFKPSGMRRGYPNIVNYEAVKGLENNKWEDKITPEHNLIIPFTRMSAGIMDYTPGAMDNTHKQNFTARFERPMTLGTRTHQIAMYIVYEAPLQMLSDSPSNYYKEQESTSFISRIPTTWDETRVLEAKISDYIIMARRKDDVWYVGGMTDETTRTFTLNFSFLENGEDYEIEIIADGVNSDKIAKDYKKEIRNIDAASQLEINMHSGGGWVAIISRKE